MATETQSVNCPACAAECVGDRATCAQCGADLMALHNLNAVADAWFNRALKAAEEDALGRALEWVSATVAARPSDATALRVQAKLWARLGRVDEARDALGRARDVDPTAPEVAAIGEAIDEAEKRLAASNGGPRDRNRKRKVRGKRRKMRTK